MTATLVKQAIIIRGPNGVGKSAARGLIQRERQNKGDSCGVVSLDDGWSPGELRLIVGAPAQRRYCDLVARPETLLLIELGLGEPEWGRTQAKGATRNPREWVDLLTAERRVTLVRLSATWTRVTERIRTRAFRPPTEWEQEHYDKIERNSWQVDFQGLSGLAENVLRTDALSPDDVARAILGLLYFLTHP